MRPIAPYLTATLAACLVGMLACAACAPANRAYQSASAPVPAPTIVPTAAASGPSPAPTAVAGAPGPEVVLQNFSIQPQTLTVSAGTTVTWVNHDDTPHTVTSVDKLFGSAALDTGDRFAYRFDTPGTFQYFCTIHPRMTATVIVQ